MSDITCDTCAQNGIDFIESVFQTIIRNYGQQNPEIGKQLLLIQNGYNTFKSQLPDNILKEVETQLRTVVTLVGQTSADNAALTTIITYAIMFIVTLFLFLCIIFNNDTLNYFLMVISLLLIIAGVLFILWYTYNNNINLSTSIQSITNHLEKTFTNAIEAGLCCTAGFTCNTLPCVSDCGCANTSEITLHAVPTNGPNPLTVTFTDITDYQPKIDFLGISIPLNPPISRTWDFGDGTISKVTAAQVTHIYTKAGTYNATLSVVLQYYPTTPFTSKPVQIIIN